MKKCVKILLYTVLLSHLNCNNSVFHKNNYIQTDDTPQDPHISCSYSDIAVADHDSKASMYEKFESRADGDKNYLLALDYKPSLADEQIERIGQISKEDARKSKPKTNQVCKIKLLTKYNPMLPKIDGIVKKDISILYSDDAFTTLFSKDFFSTIYKK